MKNTEETLTIRRMTIEDAAAVYEIEKTCFTTPWSLQSFQNEMTKNPVARYLVAQREGKIVGYAGAWLILEEGHITNIALLPQERKKGIGEALARELMQYAANLGVEYLTLEVRKSNMAAQRLYEKIGFQKVGIRKKYYEDNGEDALLMVCETLPPVQENFQEVETIFE
ncbi:MAG: ribosomal protein S18-alanine N-acetyltransferase [Clostridiales bacterium]|nr:ribosomal protein S18-alanine N-acetyltransferase [Clostridiales bacterium]